MKIEKSVLTRMGVTSTNADKYLDELNTALEKHGIDTHLRVAHFLAQIMHESAHMKFVKENLNYSWQGLRKVFRKYYKSDTAARAHHRKPERIANRVYGGRMGNGSESSGDGFRYRGRGLIQLTGKDNYKAFSDWVGDPAVLTNADLVSEQYPVTSAVYYWVRTNLNKYADLDDVRTITKRINGGTNGLDDRISLLLRAKKLLKESGIEQPAPLRDPLDDSGEVTHSVKATSLNMRSTPEVPSSGNRNRIGVLGQGQHVAVIESAGAGWVQIRALLNGVPREGYVAGRFLEKLQVRKRRGGRRSRSARRTAFVPVAIPPVHLAENRKEVKRTADAFRAYPLGEPGRPKRTGSTPEKRKEQLIEIVKYLDSPRKSHKRYRPKGGSTYCNIYACDFCYLAGVYLPRVWWTNPALLLIQNGESVPVKYSQTVRELNANSLHDWLQDHGAEFGWQNVTDLNMLQVAANQGEVCLIVAQREDLSLPGHIAAVVPEHANFKARRDSDDTVLRPLESQAGSTNYRFKVKSTQWWQHPRYRDFSLWRNPD